MKSKYYLFIAFTALLLFCPNAQSATDELVNDDYNRNSMSVIIIDRGDKYDSTVWDIYQGLGINNRFDKNIINTKRITIRESRSIAINQNVITAMVKEQNVAKQILSHWYNVSSDGAMDVNLIAKRSKYNATDEEAYNAAVSKIGLDAIGEEGYELINNSYIMVVDVSGIRSERNNRNETIWVSQTIIWVFKLDYNNEIQQKVWNSWQYEDDDLVTKINKKQAYDSISPDMKYINYGATVMQAKEGYGGLNQTIRRGYNNVFEDIVSKIPEWQVTIGISEIHPIKAKIGKKEGIKNTDRFEIFEYVEDENGNLTSESIGFMRAARVKDNRNDELGDTKMSAFYQISGKYQAREGMTIKENDDSKSSIGVAFTYGGLAPLPIYYEKLIYISPQGLSLSLLAETGITPLWDQKDGTCWNLKVGFGLSFRPVRWVEIMPYAQGGIDYNMRKFEDFSNLLQLKLKPEQSGFGYEFGVRVTANVKYPFKIFAQATAQQYYGGSTWSRLHRWYNSSDIEFMDMPLSLSLGVKYDF